MFFDGDKNSVPVGVCGTNVPDVWAVLDVVLADELEVVECAVVVVTEEEVVVVDEEFDDDGLLEHAARARAHAGRRSSRTDRVRSARGIGGVYDEPVVKGGFQRSLCRRSVSGRGRAPSRSPTRAPWSAAGA